MGDLKGLDRPPQPAPMPPSRDTYAPITMKFKMSATKPIHAITTYSAEKDVVVKVMRAVEDTGTLLIYTPCREVVS